MTNVRLYKKYTEILCILILDFCPVLWYNSSRNRGGNTAGKDLIYMESIKVMLISRYEHIAYTHRYVFGFSYGGMIYAYQSYGIGDNAILDRASSKCGGGYSLRYKPTKKQKETLINAGIARPICSTDYFNEQVVNSKYNRGEIFERMVTERAGQAWKKDNRKRH